MSFEQTNCIEVVYEIRMCLLCWVLVFVCLFVLFVCLRVANRFQHPEYAMQNFLTLGSM